MRGQRRARRSREKAGAATSTAAGKAAEHSEPLTAARLKAALLTADQAIGFEITGSSSRDGAEPDSSLNVEETVSPEVSACEGGHQG